VRGTRIAAIAALTMLVAACTGGGHGTSQVRPAANAKAASQAAARDLKITPANGATDADPAAGITITAQHGTLKNVTVHTAGDAVPGVLSQAGAVWHSQWALDTSQSYTVTATGTDGGGTVTTTSTFRTLTPAQTFRTQIFEGYNQAYGVGVPILLTFSRPITNKGRGRALPAADDLQAGRWRVVLGRQRDPGLPAP
jgi:hypothetical protein